MFRSFTLAALLAACDYGDSLTIVNDTTAPVHVTMEFSAPVGPFVCGQSEDAHFAPSFTTDVAAGARLCVDGPIEGKEYDIRALISGSTFEVAGTACTRSRPEIEPAFVAEGEYADQVHVLHVTPDFCR